jgi:hypothetical protein
MQYPLIAGPALAVLTVVLVLGQTYIALRLCTLAVAIAKDNNWEMIRCIARLRYCTVKEVMPQVPQQTNDVFPG